MMKRVRREVRNLIFLLSSASFIAFLAVVGLIYYFGTSKTYLLSDILVSPKALEKAVSKLEFTDKGGIHLFVSLPAYAEFYDDISSERSVPVLTQEMTSPFNVATPSTLTIRAGKLFQQVQFVKGLELFRVLQPGSLGEWIYFRYPEIYEEAIRHFAPI
jgi:hypothetical protein